MRDGKIWMKWQGRRRYIASELDFQKFDADNNVKEEAVLSLGHILNYNINSVWTFNFCLIVCSKRMSM